MKPEGNFRCRACGRVWNGSELGELPPNRVVCGDITCQGTVDRMKEEGDEIPRLGTNENLLEQDWCAPFTVQPISLNPDGDRPYEFRVVDATGITFATTARREKAELIAKLPELLKVALVATQLDAVIASCDDCLDADEGICPPHSEKVVELSDFRFNLVMGLVSAFENRELASR